jgi:hypothetical protein
VLNYNHMQDKSVNTNLFSFELALISFRKTFSTSDWEERELHLDCHYSCAYNTIHQTAQIITSSSNGNPIQAGQELKSSCSCRVRPSSCRGSTPAHSFNNRITQPPDNVTHRVLVRVRGERVAGLLRRRLLALGLEGGCGRVGVTLELVAEVLRRRLLRVGLYGGSRQCSYSIQIMCS